MNWLNKLTAQHDDRKFARETLENLPTLAEKRAARIIPNAPSEYRADRSFDYAVACLETTGLRLQFIRVRGDFEIYLSPAAPPHRWTSLHSALTARDLKNNTAKPTIEIPDFSYGIDWNSMPWYAVDSLLDTHWDCLVAAVNI